MPNIFSRGGQEKDRGQYNQKQDMWRNAGAGGNFDAGNAGQWKNTSTELFLPDGTMNNQWMENTMKRDNAKLFDWQNTAVNDTPNLFGLDYERESAALNNSVLNSMQGYGANGANGKGINPMQSQAQYDEMHAQKMKTLDATNAASNWSNASSAFGIATDLFGAYTGWQGLGIAEDQLDLSRDAYESSKEMTYAQYAAQRQEQMNYHGQTSMKEMPYEKKYT